MMEAFDASGMLSGQGARARRLGGVHCRGSTCRVMPGEHVVHRVRPKVPIDGVAEALRFLGADEHGRDVHVPLKRGADLHAVLKGAEALVS